MRKLVLVIVGVLVGVVVSACGAGTTAYPTKPITYIVPYATGTGPDLSTRYIAPELEKDLGQKVVIENKPGAGSAIGLGEIGVAKPDGYTIGWFQFWAPDYMPLIQDTPWKSLDDFTLISSVHSTNAALGVKADSPYKTVQDLIADAKQRPGKVTIAVTSALKSVGHINMLQLSKWGGNVEFNYIPAAASAVPDVLGGTIAATWQGVSNQIEHVKAGKIRILLAATKIAELPDVPTAETLKIPDLSHMGVGGVLGPKGIPADVVTKLNGSFKRIVTSPEYAEFAKKLSLDPVFMTPEELRKSVAGIAAVERQIATEQGWIVKK